MKKQLRLLLAGLFVMLASGVSAKDITFLPSEFTAATSSDYSLTKDGVTMSVTSSTVNDSQFRIFKSQSITFTSTGDNLTKIVFTCTANGTAQYGPGNFAATSGYTFEADGKVGTWTGNASTLTLTAEAAQVRATQIVVTVGEGGGGGEIPGPTPDPQPGEVQTVTIAAFNAAAESTDVWYQLTGTIKNLKDGDQYGNFDLEDETGSVYVYGVLSEKGGAKKKFQELVAEKGIKEGDKLTIIGNRGSYNDKIEVLNAYFVSVVSGGDTPIEPQEPDHTNVTIADLSNATAKIANVNLTLNNAKVLYANGARVFVREGDKAILFYSLGIEDLKTNAILNGSIKGKLDIYNNLNEFCKTEYTKPDALTITQSETAAEPLAIDMADAENHVSDLVKFTGVTFTDINGKNAVANLDGKTLPVYDQFGLFTDNMEGVFDLTGVITVYKENVQIYPIVISTASGVKALKLDQNTNAPAYNLSGQQVSGSYRGLIIKNGRKYMVK